MADLKISLAMATYNGAKYLQEQLDSFIYQTLQPDELVVCDDGSTDETVKILEAFSASSPFVVNVIRNDKKLGYAKNFEKAISLCSGNIIFLSDQDDVWFNQKIEKVTQEFEENPSKWIVVCDAMLTDADLNPTGLTVAGQLVSAGLQTEQLLLGCCIAFKSELKPLVLPIPSRIHGHDGWVNTLGNALDLRHFDPSVWQLYRRHGKNTSEWITTRTTPASRWLLLWEKVKAVNIKADPCSASSSRLEQLNVLKGRLKEHEEYLRRVLPHGVELDEVISRIDEVRIANETRRSFQKLPFGSRMINALKFYLIGGYRQFEGWKSLLKDVLP